MTQCLQCGMEVADRLRICPKCDSDLDQQTDGSTITVDVAHHGEHVSEALRKIDSHLSGARRGVAARLRLIVGSGLIKEATLANLHSRQRGGEIQGFDIEDGNPGAIVVDL